MNILLNALYLIVGFAVLIKGGDFLVSGASSIAKRFGVPSIVIGLTIVAFGTSAPELFVNIFAAAKGSHEIAFGNILGSRKIRDRSFFLLILFNPSHVQAVGLVYSTLAVGDRNNLKT